MANDFDDIECLVKTYGKDVLRICRYYLRNSQDAEDAFQKGLLNLLLNIETGTYQLQTGTRITTVAFEYCKRVWLTELKSARLRHRGAMPEHLDPADPVLRARRGGERAGQEGDGRVLHRADRRPRRQHR